MMLPQHITEVPVRAAPAGPSLAKLSAIEIRKAVDTRSGRALIIVMMSMSALIITLLTVLGKSSPTDMGSALSAGLAPVVLLLPIIGVLLVTSEWSQRTNLSTFAMTPVRLRIYVAKILATLALALVTVAVPIALGLVAALALSATGRAVDFSGLAGAILVMGMAAAAAAIMGVGLGGATLSPTLGIFLVLGVPLGYDPAVLLLLPSFGEYIASSSFVNWVSGETPFTGPVITSFILWFALPCTLGAIRYQRSDIH